MDQEKKDLFMQLHGQYYADNQSRMNTLITIIVALLAVIGTYGYVLAYSSCLFVAEPIFTLYALLGMTAISFGVIAVLYYITLQIGLKCRMEQFVANAIRERLLENDKNPSQSNLVHGVFVKTYNPRDKEVGNFIPNLYGDFLNVYRWIYFVISFLTILRVILFVLCEECQPPYYPKGIIIACLIVGIVAIVIIPCFMCKTKHAAYNIYQNADELYKK